MAVKVSWFPSDDLNIASYQLERSVLSAGPFSLVATVDHDLDGAAFDVVTGKFFFVDAGGTASSWYRLTAVDLGAQTSEPSAAFRAPVVPGQLAKIDHNYGGVDALTYRTTAGVAVEGAAVRIWRKTDFDLGNTETPIATTQTNSYGRWGDPIFLVIGYTYVVQFHKDGLYGPDHTEIIV